MKIEVTQSDIDNGEQKNSYDCAIAKAIKRTMGEEQVRIGLNYMFIGTKQYFTPIEARSFIEKFDSSKSLVSPFVLMLEEFQPIDQRMWNPQHNPYGDTPQEFAYVKMNWKNANPLPYTVTVGI